MEKEVLICLLLLVSGCLGQGSLPLIDDDIVQACINECQKWKAEGKDLSEGPCLSDMIAEDWVCDVAHNPRIANDNLPKNQCSAYMALEAHHFVEVDPDCKFIRKG